MDPNDHDASGRTALHVAVVEGDAARVRELLISGADPNVRDATATGFTPLILAVRFARPDVVGAFLVDWRCDWDKPDAAGLTAVHHAAASGLFRTGSGQRWICK